MPVEFDNWVFWLLGISGFCCSLSALIDAYRNVKAKKWNKAFGKVKDVGISQDTIEDESYSSSIKYVYEVKGKRYMGSSMFHGSGDFTSKKYAKKQVSEYSIDETIEVYYCPKRPEKSVLQTGYVPAYTRSIVLGLCVVLYSIYRVIYG